MLGEEIRARRKRLGLTQRELARLINVKANTMCQYENGTNEMSFAVLKNIASALKCSAVELAYEEIGAQRAAEETRAPAIKADAAIAFADPLDAEIVAMLKELDRIAKEKVIAYMRDQKVITGYYKAIRERN